MRAIRWLLLICGCTASLVFVVLLVVSARLARQQADPKAARRHGRAIPVRTVTVEQAVTEEVVAATAVTEPSQTATIRVAASRIYPTREFKATAIRVREVRFTEGSFVRKDDVLFEFDTEPLEQTRRLRDAELAAATAELELARQTTALNQKVRELELKSAEANLAYRQEDIETRQEELKNQEVLHSNKATSYVALLDSRAKFSLAQFALADAQLNLQRMQNALAVGLLHDKLEVDIASAKFQAASVSRDMVEGDLSTCRLTSPLDGFVAPVGVVPGEVVDTASELTKVFRLNPIHVRVDFPQERIDQLSLGQSAEVVLDSYPKETFQGKVVRIPAQANAQLRVLPITVELANPENRIKAGISGLVRIRVTNTAVRVPATAVIEQGRKAMVFRVEEGRARIHEIQTGLCSAVGWCEVKSGLSPGEEVVIYGTEDLRDNDPVDVNWRKWARRE